MAGTYRVGRLLARGGMGEIHEAEHERLHTRVAIKVLCATLHDDQRASQRFRAEARRLAAVRSEHVVRVFDCGELEDGTPYLVMEYLVGEDLRTLLEREGTLPVRRAVNLVVGACRGLAAVHRMGLVHRDLKPANLFVETLPDGTDCCKILDFGVAKALENDTTRPGVVVGTVRYMAPEQLEDPSSATARADVYALGTILFECLTGSPARTGVTLEETMFEILHRDVPRPSSLRPCPLPLEAVVVRAVARAPSLRFAGASELERALLPFGKVSSGSVSETTPAAQTLREGGVVPGAVRASFAWRSAFALAVALLVLGGFGGWVLRSSSDRSRPPAAAPIVPAAAACSALTPASPRALVELDAPDAVSVQAGADASPARLPVPPSRSARSARARVSSEVSGVSETGERPVGEARFDLKNPYQ